MRSRSSPLPPPGALEVAARAVACWRAGRMREITCNSDGGSGVPAARTPRLGPDPGKAVAQAAAHAARLRRRLHDPMIASAQNHLNRRYEDNPLETAMAWPIIFIPHGSGNKIQYAEGDARETLAGYALGKKTLQWTAPGLSRSSDLASQPEATERHAWAYSAFDCIRTHPDRVEVSDIAITAALDSQVGGVAILGLAAIKEELSKVLTRIPIDTKFWELPATELGTEPPPNDAVSWWVVGMARMDTADGTASSRAHHHSQAAAPQATTAIPDAGQHHLAPPRRKASLDHHPSRPYQPQPRVCRTRRLVRRTRICLRRRPANPPAHPRQSSCGRTCIMIGKKCSKRATTSSKPIGKPAMMPSRLPRSTSPIGQACC